MGLNRLSAAATALLTTGAILLAGCDGGASAVRAPKGGEHAAAAADTTQAPSPSETRRNDPRDAPVRLVAGKPFWAANRTRSAEENAQRGFERNGETFDARTVDDYVAKVHAFVDNPPKDAETLKRANGDTLIYDAKSNVFAVVSKEGAPRAMFKPDDGPTYWSVQKAREARRATAARDKDQADSG
jgi:pyocin large subunit-like protein